MNRVTAKICGLSTADTVGASIVHGASHLGFNFFPKSPRYVSAEQAASLTALVPAHIAKVGIFVDPDDELIDEAIRIGGVDTLQLHGKEPPVPTGYPGLLMASPRTADPADVGRSLDRIAVSCHDGQERAALALLSELVPEFERNGVAAEPPPAQAARPQEVP